METRGGWSIGMLRVSRYVFLILMTGVARNESPLISVRSVGERGVQNADASKGRFAAHNIAKPDEPVKYDKVPIFWSSVGKGLRYLGTGAGFDETYTDGSIDELKVCRRSILPACSAWCLARKQEQLEPG
jgi:hypothetical protein